MIINHNMGAMNANRQMGINAGNAGKSMEKLSSGLRINKAGDDAAGLAISEKMRGQIRGLDQASANSQDAISMIQTGEGALNETHSILQRMRELAVQSSTDTNTADDRSKVQSEIDQLAKEITRISNTTEFNTQNLMAGGLNNTFHIGANEGQNISLSINAMDAKSLGVAGDSVGGASFTANTSGISSLSDVSRGIATATTSATQFSIVVDKTAATAGTIAQTAGTGTAETAGVTATMTNFSGVSDASYKVQVTAVDSAATANSVTQIKYSKDGGTNWTTVDVTASAATIDGIAMAFTVASAAKQYSTGDTFSFDATAAKATLQLKDGSATVGGPITVKYGSTSATVGDSLENKSATINFSFSSLADGTATFGAKVTDSSAASTYQGKVTDEAVTYNGIDVSTQKTASTAITTINNAITKVSEERAKLGAYQNRLEHTIANLGTSSENLQSAESRIRDVNMAKEMSTFSKNNILSQAAQAMLAQANQQPQQVLQLLR